MMLVNDLLGFYQAYRHEEGAHGATTTTRLAYLKTFVTWLVGVGLRDLDDLRKEHMEAYARYVRTVVSSKTKRPYTVLTIRSLWGAASQCVADLYEADKIKTLPIPRALVKVGSQGLPTIMDVAAVIGFLETIDTSDPRGHRDRAMFELLYSSALRGGEVARLSWLDIDLTTRLVKVRQGKFKRDRVVPMTHEAVEALSVWKTMCCNDVGYVFPGSRGHVQAGAINRRLRTLLERAGLYQKGLTTHQLRHACATHLAERGAQLRYVQELLGHQSIETTVKYTRHQVEHLKVIYRRYHPRENQLYEELDEAYMAKIAALEALIRNRGQKHLAKLRKRGYTGDERLFVEVQRDMVD